MGWRGRFTKLDYLILNQDFPLLLQGCDGEALLDFFSFLAPPGVCLVRASQRPALPVPASAGLRQAV